jgi:hypothetical protein
MPNYYRISDPNDVRDLGEQMAAWLAAGNPKADAWAVQPAAPSADAVWTDGAWSVPPVATTTTAEDHLKAVGIGGERQPTLLYLRQSLAAAGKQCEELDALEGYLQMILAMYAADQSPRNDWPVPNVGFEQAVSAAVAQLQES